MNQDQTGESLTRLPPQSSYQDTKFVHIMFPIDSLEQSNVVFRVVQSGSGPLIIATCTSGAGKFVTLPPSTKTRESPFHRC
jgi:hypothetical protein